LTVWAIWLHEAAPALDVAVTTSAERVLAVCSGHSFIVQHGAPAHLHSDNGAEFVATAVQAWLALRGVQTLYIEPGKPWQNGKDERFNGTVRDECLNLHVFTSGRKRASEVARFSTTTIMSDRTASWGISHPWYSRLPGSMHRQNNRIPNIATWP
jgi:transposase InsO family protein